MVHKEKLHCKNPQSNRTEGNQSQLDLVSGEFAGERRTEADSEREASVQAGHAVLIQVQQIGAITIYIHQVN